MKFGEKPANDPTETYQLASDNQNKDTDSSATFNAPSVASRARNRTVMLSPDVTGQVRSLLQTPLSGSVPKPIQDENFLKPKEIITKVEKIDTFTTPVVEEERDEPTKVHSSPFLDLKTELKSAISDRVEGTLELKREHSKLASADRKVDELGIGGVSPFETRLDESRRSTNFNLERKLLQKEFISPPPPVAIEEHKIEPEVSYKPMSRVVGFLVSYDNDENGEVTELRVGRWVVSSKKGPLDQTIYFNDNTISAMHAVIKISPTGDIQIMDQLSDKGSGVLKIQTGQELDASDSPVKVQHGDLVRFGKRYFVYCAIPKIQIEN